MEQSDGRGIWEALKSSTTAAFAHPGTAFACLLPGAVSAIEEPLRDAGDLISMARGLPLAPEGAPGLLTGALRGTVFDRDTYHGEQAEACDAGQFVGGTAAMFGTGAVGAKAGSMGLKALRKHFKKEAKEQIAPQGHAGETPNGRLGTAWKMTKKGAAATAKVAVPFAASVTLGVGAAIAKEGYRAGHPDPAGP